MPPPQPPHPRASRRFPASFSHARPYKKYTCFLGPLTLCVSETSIPNTLDVRVTRKPRARTFEQALVIRPGTVLCLHTARASRYVRVRVFNPRVQYGRLVAGGLAVVDALHQAESQAPRPVAAAVVRGV
jgi:hypothetical protein